MILTLATAAAFGAASCDWSEPGHNPVSVDVAGLVRNYVDIPPAVRQRLEQRVRDRQYDEVATIRRDSVEGLYRYSGLRDMHWGAGRLCRGSVNRSTWNSAHVERGLVYCEDDHCLIVPTACRNISRITREVPPGPPPARLEVPGGWAADLGEPPGPLPLVDVPDTIAAREVPSMSLLSTVEMPTTSTTPTPFGTTAMSLPASMPFAGPVPLPTAPIASDPVAPVPEPSTLALLALGVGLIAWARRRSLSP